MTLLSKSVNNISAGAKKQSLTISQSEDVSFKRSAVEVVL